MQLKQPLFPTLPLRTAIKTAGSVLALTACLTISIAQAADQGVRQSS